MSAVDVLIPVLARPGRVGPTLESLDRAERDVPLLPLFLASPTDEPEIDALERAGAHHAVVSFLPGRGDFARKINSGYRATGSDWLLVAADDVDFRPGFADVALALAARTGARVVGTSDGGRNPHVRAGGFSPHPFVARSYADDPGGPYGQAGAVLHEGYSHNYVDRELAEVARSRGEWAFARRSVVEHLHPNWRDGLPLDATYERGRADFRDDWALFRERATQWRLPATRSRRPSRT